MLSQNKPNTPQKWAKKSTNFSFIIPPQNSINYTQYKNTKLSNKNTS